MKSVALALAVLSIVPAAAACHDKKKVEAPVEVARTPIPVTQPKPTDKPVVENQSVSPSLAMSGDLVSMCGITPADSGAKPTFAYDKDELTQEDRTILEQLATCLTTGKLAGRSVSLIGRADPRGTEEYNLGLGSRRSQSVGSYLERFTVPQTQLTVSTRGSIDATGTDDATWQKDRRVDIQLQDAGAAAGSQ